MPDLIDARVLATGPAEDLRTFRRSHFVPDRRTGRIEFDLDSFLPVPQILRGVGADSHSNIALVALGVEFGDRTVEYLGFTLDRILQFDWLRAAGVSSRRDLLAYFELHEAEALSAARERMRAFRETGYYDGNGWRMANWGVKWGPKSTRIVTHTADLLEFGFVTPWSFPEPAFRRLGLIYPGLRFDFSAENADLGYRLRGHVFRDEATLEPMAPPVSPRATSSRRPSRL